MRTYVCISLYVCVGEAGGGFTADFFFRGGSGTPSRKIRLNLTRREKKGDRDIIGRWISHCVCVSLSGSCIHASSKVKRADLWFCNNQQVREYDGGLSGTDVIDEEREGERERGR